MNQTALATLLDKQEITEALHNYCRAMDRIDHLLGYATFHADAIADYAGMYQGSGRGFVDFALAMHRRMQTHFHQLGNILIRLDGDTAHSESYITASFRLGDGSGLRTQGRYFDLWARRGGHWAIARRHYLPVMDETYQPGPATYPDASHRNRQDITYTAFA